MDSLTIVDAVLAWLLTSAGVATFLFFVGKRVVAQFLARNLQAHKVKLESQAEQAITEIRHELQMEALEHETRFKRLHEKRAEVIAELYKLLEELSRHVRIIVLAQSFTKQSATSTETLTGILDRMMKLQNYYYPNAIWLERDTCNGINELIDKVGNLALMQALASGESKMDSSSGWQPGEKEIESVRDVMRIDLAKAQTQLEDEFRQLLGMKTSAIPPQ